MIWLKKHRIKRLFFLFFEVFSIFAALKITGAWRQNTYNHGKER